MRGKNFFITTIILFCFFIFPFIGIMVFSSFGYIFSLLTNWGIQKRLVSPDGSYVAETYIRDGGATTSYSPQVSLRKSYTIRLDRRGNIFRGYHSRFIDIEWKDENTLVIYHDCEPENIFQQEEAYHDVNIEYIKKQQSPPGSDNKIMNHPQHSQAEGSTE
jgi:hypothetical protein